MLDKKATARVPALLLIHSRLYYDESVVRLAGVVFFKKGEERVHSIGHPPHSSIAASTRSINVIVSASAATTL